MVTPMLCHFLLKGPLYVASFIGCGFLVLGGWGGEMGIWAWKIAVGTNNGEIAFIS